jgi:hypothetical protein
MLPASWTCSYHPVADGDNDELLEVLVVEQPRLVAISALALEDADGAVYNVIQVVVVCDSPPNMATLL